MAQSANKKDSLVVTVEDFSVTVEAMVEACAAADKREVTMVMRNTALDVVVTNAKYSEVSRTLVAALNGHDLGETG